MTSENSEELTKYIEKHNIVGIFEDLLQQLVISKPDDPIDYLIQVLDTSQGKEFIVYNHKQDKK